MAEALASWLLRLRETSPAQLVLRGAVLASGVGAVLLLSAWVPTFVAPVLLGLGVLLVLVTVVSPGSLAATGVVVVAVLWWLMGGSGVGLLPAAVVALLLGVFHLTSGWAAMGPNHAGVSGAVAGRMVALATAHLLASVVLIALVVVIASTTAPSGGVLWIALGGAAVLLVASVVVRRR